MFLRLLSIDRLSTTLYPLTVFLLTVHLLTVNLSTVYLRLIVSCEQVLAWVAKKAPQLLMAKTEDPTSQIARLSVN